MTLPYVEAIADKGVARAIAEDPALAKGVNVVGGKITYEAVAQAHGLDYVRSPTRSRSSSRSGHLVRRSAASEERPAPRHGDPRLPARRTTALGGQNGLDEDAALGE